MTGTRDEVLPARADELEAVGPDIPVITKLSALLRQGGMPLLTPVRTSLEAAEAALRSVSTADREGGENDEGCMTLGQYYPCRFGSHRMDPRIKILRTIALSWLPSCA